LNNQGSVTEVQILPKEIKVEYKEIFRTREFLNSLAKHELIELIGLLSKERKRRYKRRKDRKYGNICKGFNQDELELFFRTCRDAKAKLAFRMQAYLGLRIGEVVRVKMEDIDFPRRRLSVQTEKAKTGDVLYLHDEVLPHIQAWIEQHIQEITACGGYLFFPVHKTNKHPHASPHWLRGVFRETAILCGLNEFYGKSDETQYDRSERRLHRLTTHSLRHFYVTKVYRATKDIVVAQKLARHTDLKSTQVYVHASQNDLEEGLSKTFERGLLEKQKEQEELKKLLEIWRLMK
jgi:integrase